MEKFETKHTSGPWFPVQYAIYWDLQTEPFYGEKSLLNQAECIHAKYNAQLCAAAPLLLSALIDAVKETNEYCHAEDVPLPGWMSDAKDAIQAAISQPENVKP